MKTMLAAAAVLLCAATARAGVTAGVAQTFGSRNYRGTKARASIDLDEEFYVAPSFLTYRSDDSSGTYRVFGLRAGYEEGPVSLGADAAVQPKTDGYARQELGADVTFSLTPGGSKHGRKMAGPSSGGDDTFGAGLAAVDVGAGVRFIRHADDLRTAPGSAPGPGRPATARGSTLVVGQTAFSVFGGLRFLVAEASLEATKSRYSRDLGAENLRESRFLRLPGVDAIVQGFPDTSVNARVSVKSLPLVKPYVSYTHTTFELGAAPSNAYEAGAKAGFDMVSIDASYERYVQKGYADRNYFTLGASLQF